MKFRYKVYAHYSSFGEEQYYVKIQKHTGMPIFQWETILNEVLQYVLYKINHMAFNGYNDVRYISNKDIYDELKQYKSMEEIIMTYINDIVLKDIQRKRNDDVCYDLIGKFALTNGWKTIEVKENNNE